MGKDLISIVVPVYNVENYLKRCVQSIIVQTYSNLEVILVDDGSTDKSSLMCDELKKIDKRIKVYHKKNGGLSSARNMGIKNSKGKFITFIDSDDFVSDKYIEILYKTLLNTKSDISCADIRPFCNKKIVNKNNDYNIKKYNSIEAINDMMYEKNLNNSASGKLYKTELFENINYPVGVYFEDLATTYKLFEKSKCISYSNITLYYYYQRNDSILHKMNSKKINDLIMIIEEFKNKYENNSLLNKSVLSRYVNAYFYIHRNTKNKKLRKKCSVIIKSYRKKILEDRNISKKTKYGLLLSYLGLNIVDFIFKIKYKLEIMKI